MQDAVRPSDETFTYFYERGYRTWFKLYQAAFSSFQCAPSLNLENVIPQHPYFPAQLELDRNSSSSLYATGIATWGTTEGACNLPSFKKRYVFGVTTVRPTVLSLSTRSSSGLPKWFGEEGNHTSVLTLAWAYVLSARWTEVIPGASAIQYTDSQALWLDDDGEFLGVSSDTTADGSTVIDLGDVTSDAARWWAAVLAPEEGWNACIPHNNRLLKSPWSVTLRSDQPMVLLRHTHSALPVSSIGVPFSTAARYIFDYARYHSVADQSHAAFTAALLLPMSQSITKQVCLPSPRLPSKPRLKQSSTLYSPPYGYSRPWGKDDRQLDRLLTLSCTTTGITSLLSSIFVESDIPCNVCGAWVQGAFAILTSECAKDPHVLAHMFMNRSPKLGFLWLGGILIGIQDYIMRWARPVAFLVDLHAAAWTTTSISFVQAPVSKLTQGGGVIRRSDEARLMFLSQTEHHAQPPIVPFGPFGTTAIKDCVLEVQLHAQCQGYHGLSYVGWAWDCQNKTQKAQYPTEPLVASMEFFAAGVDDVSGSNIPVRYDDLNRERDCSESVTRNMFLWLREVDGFPVAERAIYEHEWIDGWDSDESAEPEGDGKSTVERYIGPWISRTMTQRCYSL